MTSIELETALMARYPKEEYAYFSQVRNCTGYARQIRTADALALSLWPSRGLQLHGFELKISKADWKRELEAPAKADEVALFCDAWWIVTPVDIVDKADLPPTWGLLEWTGTKWKTTNPQRKIKAKPLSREFLASLIRNFAKDMVPSSQVDALMQQRLEEAVQSETRRLQSVEKTHQQLIERIATFEEASGVKISDTWRLGKDVGTVVKAVLNGEYKHVPAQLQHLRQDAARILSYIDRVLQEQPSPPSQNSTAEPPNATHDNT